MCRIGFTNLSHVTLSSYPNNPELRILPGFESLPPHKSGRILHFRFPSAQAINLLNLVDEGENSFPIISGHIAPAFQVGRVFYDLGSNLRGKNWEQQFFLPLLMALPSWKFQIYTLGGGSSSSLRHPCKRHKKSLRFHKSFWITQKRIRVFKTYEKGLAVILAIRSSPFSIFTYGWQLELHSFWTGMTVGIFLPCHDPKFKFSFGMKYRNLNTKTVQWWLNWFLFWSYFILRSRKWNFLVLVAIHKKVKIAFLCFWLRQIWDTENGNTQLW